MNSEHQKWYDEEPLNSFNFNYKSKNKKIHIVLDPFTFSISLLILFSILFCIIYYLVILRSEIGFYHQIFSEQSQNLLLIENRIIHQILNSDNIQKANKIITQVERISNQFNITQIQNNLQQITNGIAHIVPPY